MRIRKIENLDEDSLLEHIEEVCKKNEISKALGYLKRSGICINTYGSGKPLKNKVFKKAIAIINQYDSSSLQVNKFIEEVNVL
ncbi:hypothetical protein, partial [Bacillus pseudomycoides]|uniref:hypothetical protein n=1 Tax=Bacillus pseudomycoides TaxID=64104 RepID=UPI0005357F21